MIKIFLPIALMLYGAHSQAGMLDDILNWFSGDDETLATTKVDPETEPKKMTSAIKSATAERGLGAIFMAARTTLAPEDYKLINDAVPNIESYVAAAPRLIS